MFRQLSAALLALLLAPFAVAQRDAKVPNPDPEVERKTFQVADGFEVTLFAADPLLAKPIAMNFDARGRLWIASSETYPQIKPGEKANDKIIVLEDIDGDGQAEKTTVFAGGLLIPTGLEPGDGGVYVANSTELLHIAETPDGKAGKTRVLLSGFGTEDTHHILHTLRWGPDGLLYMNQSIYIHSHIETPHGPRRLNAGGIWAFRPETHQLEIFARGWVNSWGHTFDKYGQSFATDGAGGEGINWVVPGGYYPTAIGPHAQRILHGLNPGHPKYCGVEIVSGRHLPDDWQGDVITNDFRGHRVVRFKLKDDGAGFAAVQMPDVIRSTHPAFRPIDVKMGPDGAIYIADWYNPIIQHGEVDFRDPRRDKTHGRIWRITAKGRQPVERPKLAGATVEELLEQLKSPEQWTRHMAKRVLKERGAKEVLPKLQQWMVNQKDVTRPDWNLRMLEAAWVHEAFDTFTQLPADANTDAEPAYDLLIGLMLSREPGLRAYGARLLAKSGIDTERREKVLEEAALSDHPRVRLEAVRALAAIPTATAARRALRALDKPVDQWLDYALWLTARELEPSWMPKLRAGEQPFHDVKHLIFALKAVDAGAAVPTIVGLLRSGKLNQDQEASLLAVLAGVGGPNELTMVFDRMMTATAAARVPLLTALADAARQRKVRPAGDLLRIQKALDAPDDATRVAAVRLMGAWKLAEARATLTTRARADGVDATRLAAIDALAELGGRESIQTLAEVALDTEPAASRAALVALVPLDPHQAALLALKLLQNERATDDITAVVRAFVERKDGAKVLALALASASIPADAAKVALRVARGGGRNAEMLVQALTNAGRLSEPRRVLTEAEMKELVEEVAKSGDAARGEAVYRRADLACQKCHSIAGAGGLAGPDLLSIGASAQVDYLIDSLLLPNKKVKENFHSIRVETKRGQQLSGIKSRETPTELVLRDAEDREVVIQKADIDDQQIGGSIMPEGLVDPLTRSELVDLVRFLSELGKVGGKFAVGPERVVRRWQALEATPEAYTGAHRVGVHFAAVENPALKWSPLYSTVAGVVLPDAAPRIEIKHGLEGSRELMSYLRCQIEVTTGGPMRLAINGTIGLSLWREGSAVPLKEAIDLNLPPGIHTLTFAADWSRRQAPLRVELVDIPGSAARARVVGGK